jgi:uncharacterized protein YndB with AHSA1/START domain
MSSTPTIPPLTGTITVDASIERTFRVFTDSFGSWWPAEYHIGQADMATAMLEPREGGRWYEQGIDGSECDWGRVLAWEPPHRLVVTWQINGQWQYDPDPAHASEIEVRFTADGPDQTTVNLEHRHLDRWRRLDRPPGAVHQGSHQPDLTQHRPSWPYPSPRVRSGARSGEPDAGGLDLPASMAACSSAPLVSARSAETYGASAACSRVNRVQPAQDVLAGVQSLLGGPVLKVAVPGLPGG